MKALTLWQPWASAIAFGLKQYETRPRKTNHRGLLAIHAGKAMNEEVLASLGHIQWSDHIKLPLSRRYDQVGAGDFPQGVVVAVAELEDCLTMDDELIASVGAQERSLGHWEAGRYAYKLTDVKALKTPVAASGKQGMWTLDGDLLAEVLEQIK